MTRLVRVLVALATTVGLLALAACSSSAGEDAAAPSTTIARATSTSTTETAPTTTTPEPLEDQTAPGSINGLTVQGDTLWVASIDADEILQVRRADGAILARFDAQGAGPDDVAVAPDGSVYSAGFGNGDVGRIADGRYSVLTTLTAGINPIEFGVEGDLLIGTYGPGGTLYRVPLDGSEPVVEAEDLPDINAFGALADGSLLAPAGGISGPGAAVRIAPDGTITTVVDGLPPVAAAATDADGRPYVLANLTGEVIAVDVAAKTSRVARTVPEGVPFDNLAFADDGTLYLSSFAAPTITEVAPDGTTRVLTVGKR